VSADIYNETINSGYTKCCIKWAIFKDFILILIMIFSCIKDNESKFVQAFNATENIKNLLYCLSCFWWNTLISILNSFKPKQVLVITKMILFHTRVFPFHKESKMCFCSKVDSCMSFFCVRDPLDRDIMEYAKDEKYN